MNRASKSELRVRYAETDQMGVVYHANYLVWCEIGRTDFIRSIGTTYALLEQEGVLLAVSDAAVRFHASAKYDDPICVYTTLTQVRSRALTFTYRIAHAMGDRTLATASTVLVSLNRDGKMVALPDSLRERLQQVIAGSAS